MKKLRLNFFRLMNTKTCMFVFLIKKKQFVQYIIVYIFINLNKGGDIFLMLTLAIFLDLCIKTPQKIPWG